MNKITISHKFHLIKRGQFILLLIFLTQWPMGLAIAQSYVAVKTDPWYDPALYPNVPDNADNILYCGNHTRPFPVDWDGDGYHDILTGNHDDGQICYFHNNGDGHFEKHEYFGGLNGVYTPYAINWDGDLDLDIILGTGGDIDYCENTGSTGIAGGNVFNCSTSYVSVTGSLIQPALVDWDGDGLNYDIIAGNNVGNFSYLTNNGSNIFTETADWQNIEVVGNASPSVVDIDGDKDLDVVFGNLDNLAALINDGTNTAFSYVPEFAIIDAGFFLSPRFIDWDNDEHLDFITGNSRGYISLYLNDFDEDGYVGEDDADNEDSTVHKDAPEICDGQNNLTGEVDSFEIGATGETVVTYYQDQDSDTFGNESVSVTACAQPTGYVTNATDCDDTEPTANPNATEVCDNIDNNCDGNIDDAEASDIQTWYYDADQDGYGNNSITTQSCVALANFILADDTKIDCDDNTSELTTTCTDSNDSTNSGDDDNASDADGETSSSSGCGLQQLSSHNANNLYILLFLPIFLFFGIRTSRSDHQWRKSHRSIGRMVYWFR